MGTTSMDPQTAKIAVQLQLADINDLLDGLYDAKDLPDNDACTSFQIMRQDLQKELQDLEGQILTLKILKEEHENRLTFSKLLKEETEAIADHQFAMRLAGLTVNDEVVKISADYETGLHSESDCSSDTQREMAKELYATALECDIVDRAPLNGICTAKADEVQAENKSKISAPKN